MPGANRRAPRSGAITADLKEGDEAPLFTLPDDEGRPFNLADEIGKAHLILYFYPKDDTPGCRAEAQAFRDELALFLGLEATVIGVSTGTVQSKAEFKRKYALNFKLLADTEKTVSKRYGALGLLGTPKRMTFVVGKDGKIKKVFHGVLPMPHLDAAKEALFKLREEEQRTQAPPA